MELKESNKALRAYKTHKKEFAKGKLVSQATKWIMVLESGG